MRPQPGKYICLCKPLAQTLLTLQVSPTQPLFTSCKITAHVTGYHVVRCRGGWVSGMIWEDREPPRLEIRDLSFYKIPRIDISNLTPAGVGNKEIIRMSFISRSIITVCTNSEFRYPDHRKPIFFALILNCTTPAMEMHNCLH